MRSVVLRNRIQHLLKVSSLGVLGVAVAGCSSGFQRFDRSIYEEAVPQQTAYSQNTQNPYPGEIDPTITASTSRRIEPISPVAPAPVPQGVYHNPEPTYAQQHAATYQPVRQPLGTYTPTNNALPPAAPASSWKQSSTVTSSALPKPTDYSQDVQPASQSISYAPPKPETDTVYIPPAKPDPLTTSSVAGTSDRKVGWTSTGGTLISIREGETLYNLSKRYGVPVSAIREANGMNAADSLKAGQRITIPNYIYSRESAISAPDNDPKTRAASAGTGYIGEAKGGAISVPVKRPYYEYASASPRGQAEDSQPRRYQPKSHVIAPSEADNVPDYGIVTGSVKGDADAYVVKSGDSLSRIAAQHGTNVDQLRKANGLAGNSIRIGQKLLIPSAASKTQIAAAKELPKGVDPIVTGSVQQPKTTTKDEPSQVAPARTGISQFRWPVKGRVVSEFGDTSTNGGNEGIDISVPEGTAVRAAENGVVIYVGSEISAYGNLVLVRHEDNWVSAYAHNRDFEVKKGDSVRRGQIIARSGKTGNADRPKLHFELRKDSKPVNPKKYLAGA